MWVKDYLDEFILEKGGKAAELRYAGGGSGIPEVCPELDLYAPVPKYVAVSLTPIDGDLQSTAVTKSEEDGKEHLFLE